MAIVEWKVAAVSYPIKNQKHKQSLVLGAAKHRGSVRASQPAAPGSIPSVPMEFSNSHDVAEVYQRDLECGKLENVDRTI